VCVDVAVAVVRRCCRNSSESAYHSWCRRADSSAGPVARLAVSCLLTVAARFTVATFSGELDESGISNNVREKSVEMSENLLDFSCLEQLVFFIFQ